MSLKILLFLGLRTGADSDLFWTLYGSRVVGFPSTFTDFQTSVSLIWAASWFTDRRLNLFNMNFVLILSFTFELFKALSSLFWVIWSDFNAVDFLSSLVNEHKSQCFDDLINSFLQNNNFLVASDGLYFIFTYIFHEAAKHQLSFILL